MLSSQVAAAGSPRNQHSAVLQRNVPQGNSSDSGRPVCRSCKNWNNLEVPGSKAPEDTGPGSASIIHPAQLWGQCARLGVSVCAHNTHPRPACLPEHAVGVCRGQNNLSRGLLLLSFFTLFLPMAPSQRLPSVFKSIIRENTSLSGYEIILTQIWGPNYGK